MATTFDLKSLVSNNLPAYIEEIEIRTRFSPPVKIKVADLLKPADQQQSTPVAQLVKPTVILRGGAFAKPQVIAPGGVAGPDEWKLPAAALLVTSIAGGFMVVSTVFALGAFTGKRRAHRGNK